MAYLQQNQDDENAQQQSQVLNPNQQTSNVQQAGQQGPSGQGAYIEGSVGNGGQSPQSAAPAPKKASSGQFTNLRSYIQANQGAGNKIGQQLTGGIEKGAQQIGTAIAQQKQQYQAQVGQQDALRNQANQQAQQVLQQAQSLGSTKEQLKAEDIANFQQLATGQKTFQDVQDMNLTPQQVQQQEIARKAEALKSFEGRAGQLKETFGKQRQYGAGAGSLDSLLLQNQGLGDVLTKANAASTGTEEQLKGAQQFGRDELARLIADNQNFSKGLQTQAETGQEGVIKSLTDLEAQKKAQRLNELNTQFNPFLTAEQQELQGLQDYYGGEAVRQRVVDSSKQALGNQFDQTTNREVMLAAENMAKSKLMSFEDFQKQNKPRNIQEATTLKNRYQQYYNEGLKNEMANINNQLSNPEQAEQLRQQMLDQYIKTGTGTPRIATNWQHNWDPRTQNILNTSLTGNKMDVDDATLKNLGISQTDIDYVRNKAEGKYISTDLLNQLIGKIGTGISNQQTALPKALSDALKQSTGYGFEDYTQGNDLSRESLATDADRARYSALSALAGRQASDLQYGKPSDAIAAKELTEGQMKELLAKIASSYGRSNVASVPGGGVAATGTPKVNIG